jgi:hypothetical protein
MGFTASDLADWFDEQADEYWRQQDDWLIEANNLGNAYPVIVFANWFTDRVNHAPQRFIGSVAGGIADVLRLGCDLSFDSVGDFALGVLANVARLLTVIQPETASLKDEFRHQGLLALMKLRKITGTTAPCQFSAVNNIVSFLKRRNVQYFADIRDIVAAGGSKNVGMYIKPLLEHPSIVRLIGQNGITWRPLTQAKTIDDVIAAARSAEGPVRFTFKWIRQTKEGPKSAAHAVVAIKDPAGSIRIIDYTEGLTAAPSKLGFPSWQAMVDARKATWGEGLTQAKLSVNPEDLPAEFSSTYLKMLTTADGVATFGLPVAIGMKWVKDVKAGASFDDAAPAIAKSVTDYLNRTLGSKSPGGPESLYPPPTRPPETVSVMYTHTVEGPSVKQSDWLSSIAKKWYGDMLLWPIIFDFNRTAQFSNPNVIVVGQRIKVPFINNMTPAQLADYRKRGLNWK